MKHCIIVLFLSTYCLYSWAQIEVDTDRIIELKSIVDGIKVDSLAFPTYSSRYIPYAKEVMDILYNLPPDSIRDTDFLKKFESYNELNMLFSYLFFESDKYRITDNSDSEGRSSCLVKGFPSDTMVLTKKLQIDKIEENQDAYFIQVHDTLCYTLLSVKTDTVTSGEKLQEGQSYIFSVNRYFLNDIPRPKYKVPVIIGNKKLYVPLNGVNILQAINLQGVIYLKIADEK